MAAARRIVLVAFPDAQSLDFVGPLEVFGIAERLSPGSYTTEVVAPGGRPFKTNGGLAVVPDRIDGRLPRRDRHVGRCGGTRCA